MWAGTLTWARPVEEALGLVDLRHRVGVPVKQLSGGEQRRLDLAMAILGRPEVLILDEPATGLDPESRLCTWRLVRDLLESGTTEVLSTHNVAEAEELGGPPRDPAPGQDRPGRHPGRGDCVLASPGLVHAPPGHRRSGPGPAGRRTDGGAAGKRRPRGASCTTRTCSPPSPRCSAGRAPTALS